MSESRLSSAAGAVSRFMWRLRICSRWQWRRKVIIRAAKDWALAMAQAVVWLFSGAGILVTGLLLSPLAFVWNNTGLLIWLALTLTDSEAEQLRETASERAGE